MTRNSRNSPPTPITFFISEMRTVLHIFTRPENELALEVVAKQQALAEVKIEVADLTATDVNYDDLIEKIFSADSVEVW
jgi:hypothetical protein